LYRVPSVVELLSQANSARDRKRFQEALGHLDQALQLAPDDPWALSRRGGAYLNLGRNKEALRDLDRALQLTPDDPGPLSSAGACSDGQPSWPSEHQETEPRPADATTDS
jgi:Flp pilus assembly protein TadD